MNDYVRSKTKPINSHFRKKYLDPLISKGGEFVELKEEEIKPLLAIRSIYQKRESDYKVTEEQISKFIQEKGADHALGVYNKLLLDILSDPSYQMPQNIADEPESSVGSDNNPINDPVNDPDVTEANDLKELWTESDNS
ncbi:hypothetical protein IQ268_04200 [Oculatella sp. LEGE 06141]|uniref:hypothetical protein n=1 Tax=Oculatella sp. LEGE 06141 TaxID=1828648 RepID=UPI0018827194|nr:hypothetical protein [Oculatella sp. LEGE 06141]MBE9177782.1 hypothetical protein [Oculatella sp. LEGE 06141]